MYKMRTIIGCDSNYRKRVYALSREELMNKKSWGECFLLRETTLGEKVYMSADDGKMYIMDDSLRYKEGCPNEESNI